MRLDIFGQNGSLAPFVDIFLPLSVGFYPVSQHLDTFGMERGVKVFPIPLIPGGNELVCELLDHMIDTHLILLEVNIFSWHGRDSGREKRGEDKRQNF